MPGVFTRITVPEYSEPMLLLPEDRAALEAQPLESFGDFEVLEQIAQGGMGVVYRARQISLNRIVALKTIRHNQLSEHSAIQRFQTEARAAAKLSHPHIVPIYEVGSHDGQHYYSMAFVDGPSLAKAVGDRPLPPRMAAELVETIARAIHYAHTHGVLHRDLKPGNVLLDEDGQPHVTDFGLAKLVHADSDVTVTGVVLGSPSYMSPEQAEARVRDIEPRSDVYSLGAILYFLLTGRPPFRAQTALQTIKLVIESDPVAPRWLNPAIPADLETICFKCLEKRASHRYTTAKALAEDLHRFLNGQSIVASPVGTIGRAVRWCRRSPNLTAALATTVLAILGGVAGVTWQWREAEHERDIATARLYAADMNLVSAALDEGNMHRARQLLDEHRADGQRLGSFDWRYLNDRASGNEQATFVQPGETFRQVALSLDHSLVLGRTLNHTLSAWETSSQRLLWTASNVTAASGFSRDGQSMGVSLGNGDAGLCDIRTGKVTVKVKGAGLLLDLCAGGELLATTTSNALVQFWHSGDGSLESSIPGLGGYTLLPQFEVTRAAVSVSGRVVASIIPFDDQRLNQPLGVEFRDAVSGQHLRRADVSNCLGTTVSPDGRWIAVGGSSGRLAIIPRDASLEPISLQYGKASIRATAFSPDSGVLAIGSSDNTIYRRDLANRRDLPPLRGHHAGIQSLAYSSDGQWLVSGSRDGTVKLWRLDAQPMRLTARDVVLRTPVRVVISPDSEWVAAAGLNETVRLFDKELRPKGILKDAAKPIRFSQTSNALIALSADGQRLEWRQLASGEISRAVTLRQSGNANDGSAFAVDKSERWCGFGGPSGTVRVVNNAGETIAAGAFHRGLVRSLDFSPDGKWMASGGEDGAVFLWPVQPGTTAPIILGQHSQSVMRVSFAPDARTLASASFDGTVKLWNTEKRLLLGTLTGHRQDATDVQFTPDGRVLASSSADGTIKLWNVRLRQEVTTIHYNDDGSDGEVRVSALALSPDGAALVAFGGSGELRLWRPRPVNKLQ